MNPEILTPTQIALLKAIGGEPFLKRNFYLTGGTPLAAFYLQHRYSEDLDFFSMEEVDALSVAAFFEKQKTELGIKNITSQTSMNRNLFFLTVGSEQVKTEFTYFPFTPMEPQQEQFGVRVDSAKDIAVNKLFTIYQRSKARDYIDLYFLHQKYNWSIEELVRWAKLKFDWHIDLVQLASQFVKGENAEDYPRMIVGLPKKEWQDFFKQEALKLKPDILE